MQLSSEDALRLNVLLMNAEAIRVDENRMVVYGLNGEQELKVELNATCRADKYLSMVRETLSSAVLDSPGGYPVFLRRWTRMGQIDNDQIDRLLRLGEPEAVMAVVCSPGLTDELARRAWWAAPTAEHARRMLENPRVRSGSMGPILADYLLEFLPFETEHRDMLASVRLALQPGLIDDEKRQRLWDAGRSRKTYRIGFLFATPDDLPEQIAARGDHAGHAPALAPLAAEGNPYARLLEKLLGGRGQSFMHAALDALKRPADQDVVAALLNAIGSYFREARIRSEPIREMDAILSIVEQSCSGGGDARLQALLAAVPQLEPEVRAMLTLAHIDETVVIPIFAVSDAVGSVMRKRIEPVAGPIREQFAILGSAGA